MLWNPFPMISLVLEIKMNADGSSFLMKFLRRTACWRLSAVKIIDFCAPENAPCASQMVAPRCSSWTMKSQIGPGLLHTTLKYFERFKLSIKLSTRKERIASPKQEKSPVLIPNMKKPAMVIAISETRSAFPMLRLEYFFMIMAIISVPPLDDPMLNKIADPKAGSAIANITSSIG